jgi:polyphosphate glucokinase
MSAMPTHPTARRHARGVRTLAVDIGGTGLKVLVLDRNGRPITQRIRVDTPQPPTPAAVIEAVVGLAARQGPFDRVSVGFPGVVRDGVTETAPNLDPRWAGVNLRDRLSQRLGRPVRVCNDADVQGFGVIAGRGVELVITLGTGVGSALFVDGKLVRNLELGHHPSWKGKTYEDWLGLPALKQAGKKRWNKRVGRALRLLDRTFNYDRLYIGGGNARKLTLDLPPNVQTVPNLAGLLGGIALWSAQYLADEPSPQRPKRRGARRG